MSRYYSRPPITKRAPRLNKRPSCRGCGQALTPWYEDIMAPRSLTVIRREWNGRYDGYGNIFHSKTCAAAWAVNEINNQIAQGLLPPSEGQS